MGFLFCIKTTPIPIFETSQSISIFFVKLGKVSNGTKIRFSFNKLKAFSYSISHLKPTIFFPISINEAVIVLKFFTNLL